jgi:hypothetical protein
MSESKTPAQRLKAILDRSRPTKGVTVIQLMSDGRQALETILTAYDPMYEALKAQEAFEKHTKSCDQCGGQVCMEAYAILQEAKAKGRAALSKAEGGPTP